MAHYSKIKIYPVSKNSRNTIYKVFLIDPGYFFSEKFIKNARVKQKILLIRILPEQTKLIDRLILLFHCSIVLFSRIYEYMQNLFYRFP